MGATADTPKTTMLLTIKPLSLSAESEIPPAFDKRGKGEFAKGKEENSRMGFSFSILLRFAKKLFLLTAQAQKKKLQKENAVVISPTAVGDRPFAGGSRQAFEKA